MIEYQVFERAAGYRERLDDVRRLFEDVFARPFPWAGWEQGYFRNPYGEPLAILAYDGDRLVGHHALTPQMLIRDSVKLPYMLSKSTMVHRHHRNLLVLSHMEETLHQAAQAQGYPFVLGFPNANSAEVLRVLFGYRTVAESPLCNWIPDGYASCGRVDAISGLSQNESEWSYPADQTYWQWRGICSRIRCLRVDDDLELVCKGPEDGVLTVLDMTLRPGTTGRAILGGFARAEGATSVRLMECHARAVGIPTGELISHENYTVRMACRELGAAMPDVRFSLLLSDVF